MTRLTVSQRRLIDRDIRYLIRRRVIARHIVELYALDQWLRRTDLSPDELRWYRQQFHLDVGYVQNKTSVGDVNGSNDLAITFDSNVTAASAIIVAAFWKGDVTITASDDHSGSYTDCGAGRIARPTDG